MNLLSNAVLATSAGETISVEVCESGASAEIVVVDQGEGMSAEVLARLGDIFFTTRGHRGSGLGIGICKQIAERHGGTLEIDSTLGEGTRATVRLPLLAAETP